MGDCGVALDRRRIAGNVASLVRIPSVNPLHAGPRAREPGERALAEHLAARFAELGAEEVTLDPVIDDRPNVYARFAGRSDALVVIDVHTDTVTVEHMTDDPFDGRIEDGRVWGRGALDTKATLGVVLTLLEEWQARGVRPRPNLLVIGTVGEEGGGLLGAMRFRQWATERRVRVDQIVSAEPTQLAPIHGHKGGMGMRVSTLGVAAHSAQPHLGKNAIFAMAKILEALEAEHRRLEAGVATTPVGVGSLSVGLIEGGTGANVVPARCTINVGRRLVPGEDPDVEYDRLVELIERACPLPVDIESLAPPQLGSMGSPAFYVPADTPLISTLARAAGTEPAVAPFGTNALRYGGFVPEIAVFGPGCIDDAHQATEWVEIDDLMRTADALSAWLDPA